MTFMDIGYRYINKNKTKLTNENNKKLNTIDDTISD